MKNVAGIDVHKDVLEIAYRKAGDIQVEEIPYTPDGMTRIIKILRTHGIREVFIESTGDYYYPLYYALKGAGIWVNVMNAYKIKRPEPNKTDERDAVWLLRIGETKLFNPSYIPEDDFLALRILVRERMWLSDKIADLKRKVTSLCWRLGIRIKNLSSILRSRKRRRILLDILNGKGGGHGYDELSRVVKAVLRRRDVRAHIMILGIYLRTIDFLEEKLAKIDRELVSIASKFKGQVEILMSVPGIGFILAVGILSEIGDISRFPSPSNLASYAGLAPVVHESAGKARLVGASKKSNKYLRRYMFMAAMAAMHSKSPRIKAFAERLFSRGKHFKVVAVAVARKLLTIIWYLLTRNVSWSEENFSKMVKFPRRGGCKISVKEAILILERAGYEARLKRFGEKS